jgi:HK97 family phage portal protein
MTYTLDPHGMVTKYTQALDKSTVTVDLSPDQVIRWWLPDPRASKAALSPISKVQDAVYQWNAMSEWATKFFKQGARPSFMVQFPDDSSIEDARRFAKYFHENHTGRSNAHIPLMLFNGAKAIEFSKGTVEFDFLKSMGEVRDQILSAYGIPLSMLGIQETAHLGSGTGESADKAFKANVINPLLQTILEKLNWRLVIDGFKITDSMITVKQADLRNDTVVSDIQDKKIRNGTLTINEGRAEDGRGPVEGGDEAVFAVSKEVLTVENFTTMADTSDQNTQLDLDTKKAQLDKIKNPPPTPAPLQQDPEQKPPAQGKQQPEEEEDSKDA